MINQPLKEVIENLSDTINAVGMNKTITDETIFVQACTFLRTPGFVGESIEKPSGKKEEKVKKPNAKPTEGQIKFLCKNNIDHDSEKMTRGEASVLISKYIAEHPRI